MYFADVFKIDPSVVETYGAFNVSLVNDLPLFIDPFLLFNSKKPEYQELHKQIIKYIVFLRDESLRGAIDDGLIKRWFHFSEVKQNWLGFSKNGNSGSGLGASFAVNLHKNFSTVLRDFGTPGLTKANHLEKLCLFDEGVGRDNISDFSTNLIKRYLLEYTQAFARAHLDPKLCAEFAVDKVSFSYSTRSWEREKFFLPRFKNDFVLLTPRDILTKDDTWISKESMYGDFYDIVSSVDDKELRAQINDYFRSHLPKKPKAKQIVAAKTSTFRAFPKLVDYYIRYQENLGGKAESISAKKVEYTQKRFFIEIKRLASILLENSQFFDTPPDSYQETLARVLYLKQVIEKNDGYRVFYDKGEAIGSETDLHILFRLVWFDTTFSVDSEVNNGRGPVDYKVSKGFSDSTLVEFKLASNSQLERNLEKQLDVYLDANTTKKGIKVILFFSAAQEFKVRKILKKLKIDAAENVILIDGRRDNKPSASRA